VTRHLLDIDDLNAAELRAVLDAATVTQPPRVLEGRGVACVFEKPSARTRNATEMAVVQLGGHPVTLRGEEVGFDVRETVEDVARTLACYHAVICARVFDHTVLERMVSVVDIPVVNLLSDRAHPCQALADLLTLEHEFGPLGGRTVAYIGDFNNVARSLGLALGLAGATIRFGCPPGFGPGDADLEQLGAAAPSVHDRPEEAVKGADAVYTDVWTSMGQEAEAEQRRRAFAGWTVTPALMEAASSSAIFLHCLPAHRGEEVDAAVVDGASSRVWPQASYRLDAARGALCWLLAGEGPSSPTSRQ
jgi:ornithine carbamoyltransferase